MVPIPLPGATLHRRQGQPVRKLFANFCFKLPRLIATVLTDSGVAQAGARAQREGPEEGRGVGAPLRWCAHPPAHTHSSRAQRVSSSNGLHTKSPAITQKVCGAGEGKARPSSAPGDASRARTAGGRRGSKSGGGPRPASAKARGGKGGKKLSMERIEAKASARKKAAAKAGS